MKSDVTDVAICCPELKHGKGDNLGAPEVTAQPEAKHVLDPYGEVGGVQHYLKLKRASGGSSNALCHVVGSKRVPHKSAERTEACHDDKFVYT